MDVKLVLRKGAKKQTFRLRSAETVVGRRQGCELRIPSETVSRRHCRLSYRNDYLSVEDLASVNGTYVNGERVVGPQVLRPGDKLTVGALTFVVQYQLSPAAIEHLLKGDELANLPEDADARCGEQHSTVMPVNDDNETANFVPDGAKKAPQKAKPKKSAKPGKPAKKKPAAPSPPVAAADEDDEQNPDASLLLGGPGTWPAPSGDDLRDILSQLEEE